MSLDQCFSTGQLKHVSPDLALAKKSLKRGQNLFDEIRKLKDSKFLEVAEQRLYQAFFHLVKTLLYKDGIKERSHYCTILYVKEIYGKKLKSDLVIMDLLKDLRNQSQYGTESPFIENEEFERWLKVGEDLAQKISLLLEP